jgi:hypothetical protein
MTGGANDLSIWHPIFDNGALAAMGVQERDY